MPAAGCCANAAGSLRRVEQDDLHKGTPWATWAERAGQVLRRPQAVVFLDMPADLELSLYRPRALVFWWRAPGKNSCWRSSTLPRARACTSPLARWREKDFSFAIASSAQRSTS